ncbi:MAG: hypothetical protein H9W81_04610 [Enterococcus sp.]|nr:hypothetical protein [Enterococcus sp.]
MIWNQHELSKIGLDDRVATINELINQEGNLNKLINSDNFKVSRGKLFELLRPYEYDKESHQFVKELPKTQPLDPQVELLGDIKDIMLQLSRDVSQIKQQNQSVKMYESQEDELISRSFRIYHNINERLKQATKSSDMNQQQLFNALLDKGLKELGY